MEPTSVGFISAKTCRRCQTAGSRQLWGTKCRHVWTGWTRTISICDLCRNLTDRQAWTPAVLPHTRSRWWCISGAVPFSPGLTKCMQISVDNSRGKKIDWNRKKSAFRATADGHAGRNAETVLQKLARAGMMRQKLMMKVMPSSYSVFPPTACCLIAFSFPCHFTEWRVLTVWSFGN